MFKKILIILITIIFLSGCTPIVYHTPNPTPTAAPTIAATPEPTPESTPEPFSGS